MPLPVNDDAGRRFEEAWRRGEPRPLAECLPAENDPQYLGTLLLLIELELELAWRRYRDFLGNQDAESLDNPKCVNDYLERFPRLRDDAANVRRLLKEEYIVRHRYGDRPGAAEYCEHYADFLTSGQELEAALARAGLTVEQPPPSSPATDDPFFASLPADFADRYRVLDRLGRGGMGYVYLAHDTRLDTRVALKISKFQGQASALLIKQFLREARAAAGLQHPGLCRVLDFGEHDGLCYYTMDYFQARRLSELVAHAEPLEPQRAARIILETARALAVAHAQGVCHRDLKPANILIMPDDRPVVIDFGLAERANDPLDFSAGPIGTAHYMSPEQFEGRPGDQATDIYSLGVTLFQLLTGQFPFQSPDWQTLKQHVLRSSPVFPAEGGRRIDPRLQAICLKALAKKPGDRYRTMKEFAAALEQYLHPMGKSNRLFLWVASTAAIVLLGLVVLNPFRKSGEQDQRPVQPPGKLMVLRLDVNRFANIDDEFARPMGVLGKDSYSACLDDQVTVEVALSKPAYAFVIAYRTDGAEELCFPESEDEPPPLTERPRYPSVTRGVQFGLNEGVGLQVFAVAASSKPLPSYRQWRAERKESPWKKMPAPPEMVWFDDGVFLETLAQGGHDRSERGKGKTAPGCGEVVQLTDWLRQAPHIEVAASVGFGVLPKTRN